MSEKKKYKDGINNLHKEIYRIHDDYRDEIFVLKQEIDSLNRVISVLKSEADSREKYITLLKYNRKII